MSRSVEKKMEFKSLLATDTNSDNISGPTDDRQTSTLPIPVELLHKIALVYLADAFWSLIIEPGLDKEWDPLSALLHTSFRFREVTTDILSHIVGPAFVDPGAGNRVKYHEVLVEVKRLKTLAESGDPRQLSDPELTEFATALLPLVSADAPILWRAGDFAINSLQFRLYEVDQNWASVCDATDYITAKIFPWTLRNGVLSSMRIPTPVFRAILKPIQEHFASSQYLVGRISTLRAVCDTMQRSMPILSRVPAELVLEQQHLVDQIMQWMRSMEKNMAERIKLGENAVNVQVLRIPDNILEEIKLYKVLLYSQMPQDRPDDDPFRRLCTCVQELLFCYLQDDQKETLMLRLRLEKHESGQI
ncbi:hypothetical protein EWM64_g1352 [Hericium alpestre]|uniref:Uncharacterized protein n=1 Tax=Hericium alpestre TaxID=135208 RepID=A0A4Z0A8R3_9AGAM|nr:hypothetical protein EWM64_g1352 [Hericium alpestre]